MILRYDFVKRKVFRVCLFFRPVRLELSRINHLFRPPLTPPRSALPLALARTQEGNCLVLLFICKSSQVISLSLLRRTDLEKETL